MKIISVYKPVMCLAFFVSLIGSQSFANGIQACVAQACTSSSSQDSIADFLALEKETHPKLEEFYGKYKSDIDKIRLGRKKAVVDAVAFLSETDKVSKSIIDLPERELMKLFVEHSPWNTETDYVNGEYEVVAEPLVGSANIQQVRVITQIFNRLKGISSLYRAQIQVDQLNIEPRQALGVSLETDIAKHILEYVTTQISMLPSPQRVEYQKKFTLFTKQMEAVKEQYGDSVYLYLGDFDLEIQVLLGKVDFRGDERSIVEQILIDQIPGVISGRSQEIANLETIYSESKWEATCRFAYNRSLHYGITQAEKNRIENEMKSEAVRRSEVSLIKIFGAEMTSQIIGYIKTMKIGGPLSFPEYVSRAEKQIKFYLEDSEIKDRSLLDHYNLVTSMSREDDGAIDNICNSWIFEPLRDSVSGNNVILSSYSAKHYEVGLAIAIHEMGHAASVALDLLKNRGVSITPFEEIRACISNNYKDSNRAATYEHSKFNADKLWTEEDWADSFAGFAMPDLQTNAKCGFIGALPEHDYATMSERSEDTHSPSFYRILNVHAHLGNETPNLCKASLEQSYDGIIFEDCISKFLQK